MTKLSVNINKIALMRNARGHDIPNVMQFAEACKQYGADGVTVHPRPDERHIRKSDVYELAKYYPTANYEYNIEGYPSNAFIKTVSEVKPTQCTLVPDAPNQLTSDHGWDTIKSAGLLTETTKELQRNNIRVSLFIDADKKMLEGAKKTGVERIEFYTGPYARMYEQNKEAAVKPFKEVYNCVKELNLGINAGHDLNLNNLTFLKQSMPDLLEVSIGQALINDCLYYGLENAIQMYKRQLNT